MFEILVYLYQTYYRPDVCPTSVALLKKLTAAGFEESEIAQTISWLAALAQTTDDCPEPGLDTAEPGFGIRIYVEQEISQLGLPVISFIQFLQRSGVIDAVQREIVIERALAASESELSLDKLKIIVVMVLWSQGKQPDNLLFDELFVDVDPAYVQLLH